MFELGMGVQDTPSFNNGVKKSLVDRLNMGRLFIFNLFAGAAMLFITVIFSAFKFYVLPRGYQGLAFLLFTIVLGLSSLTIFLTSRQKRTELFSPVCLAYIGVFSTVMYCFCFRSTSTSASLIFYWIMMMVVAIVPIIKIDVFFIIWGVELVPAIILAIVKSFPTEGIIALAAICIMSFMLSYVSYIISIEKINYKASLNSALAEAETDPMTRLLNRRGLDRRLANLWPFCIRQNSCVAVIMIDIDNFKKYNDTFGHAEGDECIKKVTAAIRKNVKRRTDYAARVGGEEFLVFLVGIEPKLAVKWALALKNSIDALKIPHTDTNFNPYVSVSMGLACEVVQESSSFEKLRAEADTSLYDAKFNGKACLYYHHKCYGKRSPYKKKIVTEPKEDS